MGGGLGWGLETLPLSRTRVGGSSVSDSYQAAVQAGQQAEAAGRGEEAFKHYSQAIELDRDEKSAYLYRGAVLSGLGRNEEALKDYNYVLNRDPGFAPALWGRGAIFRKLNRLDDSLADLEAAIQTHNMPVYHLEKANTLIAAEKFQEALKSLQQVVELSFLKEPTPENAQYSIMAMRTMAQIHRAHGNEELASGLEQRAAGLARTMSSIESTGTEKKSGCGGAAAATLLCLLPFALRWLMA